MTEAFSPPCRRAAGLHSKGEKGEGKRGEMWTGSHGGRVTAGLCRASVPFLICAVRDESKKGGRRHRLVHVPHRTSGSQERFVLASHSITRV